jgi:hypothetical protein
MKTILTMAPGINKEITVGVPYLAALLRCRGHEVATEDLNAEFPLDPRAAGPPEKACHSGKTAGHADRKNADGRFF